MGNNFYFPWIIVSLTIHFDAGPKERVSKGRGTISTTFDTRPLEVFHHNDETAV